MKCYVIEVKTWLLTPVPRWRTIVLTVAFIATMTVVLFYGGDKIFAATYTWTQTSWSGGATANNVSHTSNQTGWTEYSAKDASLTANTSLSLSATAGSQTKTSDTDFNNTTVHDLSGNNNDGTLTNMDPVTDYTTGQIGNALNFDGVDDYVKNTSLPFTSGVTDLSIFFWVKGNSAAGKKLLSISGINSYKQNITFEVGNTWPTRLLVTEINNAANSATPANYQNTAVVLDDSWHQVGIRHNNGGNFEYFVDGIYQNGISAVNMTDVDIHNIFIGSFGYDSAQSDYFPGLIDDVRIYNRALSSTEVTQLYNSASSSIDPTGSGGVVGYWSFDDGPSLSNSTVTGSDSSASVNLSIASRTPAWTAQSSWDTADIDAYTSPSLADLDGDGDLDLMIGLNDGIAYGYKNTGSSSSPTWTAQSSWNTADVGYYASPSLADLDGDGDLDLMIGSQAGPGTSYGYKNTGTTSIPTWTAESTWNVSIADGGYSSPSLADLDGDGDLDLMIGSGNGISYGYQNTGSSSIPTWTAQSSWNTADIGSNASPSLADLDGDGDLDLMIGLDDGIAYGYKNTGSSSSPTWTAQSSWNTADTGGYSSPALADLDNDEDYDLMVGDINGVTFGYQNTGTHTYQSSGTFTSNPIDTSMASDFTTLSWNETLPANTDVTIQMAHSTDGLSFSSFLGPDGTSGTSFTTKTGETIPTAFDGKRYVKYKITLTTSDNTVTPSLDDITLNYQQYPTASQTLTSSPYNSTDTANVIGNLIWTEDTSLPSGTNIQFQLRTSSDNSTWTSYLGPDGTTGTYFSNAGTGCSKTAGVVTCSTFPSTFTDGSNDQWVQYKTYFSSTGASTPTLSDVSLRYVVNAPPEFNSSNGLTVAQVSDSADVNWGKIRIDYSVRDTDTSSGTTDPGYVTPSFQYNIGGGWVTINSNKLSTDATLHKAVNSSSYTTFTAYWDAQTDIANNYLTTAQIKVTVNDQEAANNTASSTSSNFTLDTKVPTISAFKIDSTLDQLTLTSADDSILQYRISNNSDLSADGSNATSGQWQSPAVNSISLTPSWVLTGAPSYETAYLQVRDVLGNVSSATVVVSSTPTSMYIQDISNVEAETYKEFISWDIFVPTTGSVFSGYQVYRSTDGSSYSLLVTISGVSTNYYVDSAVSLNTTYYYKVRVTDTDTDIGNYGAVVTDKVDGQGGSDTTAPNITSVTVTEQQATYATVTWTTDEISNSEIDYSISPSTTFGTVVTSASYVTSHSVTITGLTPNTTYLFRVKSTDVLGNVATNNNSGAGFTIVTSGGPVISNVTETEVNEHSATIFWNTNTNSDSHVSFSTNSSLSSPTRSGSNTLVGGPPYQHKVSISGLTAGTKYYYFVESTDASSNNSKDTNGNSYYSFTTTFDTKAPAISGVSVPVSALTAAVVIWSTDEVATGIVDYGTVSGTYPSSTTLDSTLTIFHIGSLSSLTENTKYYYRVRSSDNAGNEATSSEYNFTTDKTHVVTVSGGGGGSPPVVLDTTPPVISNIKIKDVKSFNATVSFDTNEDSVGFVNYSADPVNLNLTSGDSLYSQSHEIKLSGLTMGKKYSFVVKMVDKSGNISTSPANEFTTAFFTESLIQLKDAEAFQKEIEDAIESVLPSLVPPFIEKPQVVNITDNSATVTWRTNVKSYGSVFFADDSTYNEKENNPYVTEIADTLNKVIEHKIDLLNLQPNTRYHIMARSFSLPEVVGKSKDLTFITEALKIKANIGNVTNNSFKAIWITSEPTTSIVEYRNMKTGELNQKSSDTKTKVHEISVDNLTPGTSYAVNVFGYNEKGNKISITSSTIIKTSIDTTAPKITSLTIDSALIPGRNDRAQTIVSWKTDEPSTSAVFFKEGVSLPDEKLTNKVEMTNNFVIDHAVVVSSLKPGGLYSIQVSSTDTAGNTALFPIRTAVVPEQSESVIEIIFKNFEDTFRFLKQ